MGVLTALRPADDALTGHAADHLSRLTPPVTNHGYITLSTNIRMRLAFVVIEALPMA